MKASDLSISLYLDYREFLRNWFQNKKERHKGHSLRSFARRAGFRSHNFLKMVTKGERNLTTESIRKMIRGLQFKTNEAEYFEILVHYNQEEDVEERQKLYEKLLQLQEISQLKKLESAQYDYYKDWYHTVIREMISQPDFQEDPRWIARKLSPPITPDQARDSLKLLQKLGLARKNKKGKIEQTDKLLTTGPEIRSNMIVAYQQRLMDLAKSAIQRIPMENRDISCLTLGISQERFPLLKRRLQLFREELLRLVSTDQKTDTVVQVNLQLFPLTEPVSKRSSHA